MFIVICIACIYKNYRKQHINVIAVYQRCLAFIFVLLNTIYMYGMFLYIKRRISTNIVTYRQYMSGEISSNWHRDLIEKLNICESIMRQRLFTARKNLPYTLWIVKNTVYARLRPTEKDNNEVKRLKQDWYLITIIHVILTLLAVPVLVGWIFDIG